MEGEEGLPHLHTDRFLCVLRLNLNRPTCPSAMFFNTFVLSLSPFVSIPRVGLLLPLSTSAHRAITTRHYHTISVSLHLFHYLSVPRSLSSHIIAYSVCVRVCVCGCNTPRSTVLHRHRHVVDVPSQFTGFLRLQCITVFTSAPAYK